ncbi:MAG TPA: GDSL-type esterase/lipase family protein [Candidatus Deferrimicrobium sp.]|nr:GDSL-type esterase/lipase family protein [Candidatus Deferrimicrobium sp.]
MQTLWKLLLIASIVLNLIAIWGLFHYVRYGGSPLGELKRRLTGGSRQNVPQLPFLAENERIMAENAKGIVDPLRVVFLGASITNRWDLQRDFPWAHMINRGAGGQLVPAMLSRYKRDVLDLKPKAVVLKFCSINIRPQIPLSVLRDAMMMMVQLARGNDIVPIVSTIIPAGKPEAHIGDFSVVDSLASFNEWVRSFAVDNSVPIIDFAAAIQDEHGFLPRQYSTDPVHVNEAGYRLLAEAARPVIYQAIGIP